MRRDQLRRLQSIEARVPRRYLDLGFLSTEDLRFLETQLAESVLQDDPDPYFKRIRKRVPRFYLKHGEELQAMFRAATSGRVSKGDKQALRRLARSLSMAGES